MSHLNFDFGREQRLLKPRQFTEVFRNSRRSTDAFFTVRAHYTNRGTSRLGLAISKKHARHAVTRNRLKRQAREQFRLKRHHLAVADYVIVNHAAAASATNPMLAQSLAAHFDKLSIRQRPQMRNNKK